MLFDIKNIVKIYSSGSGDVKALDNMSLKIHDGEFVVILGQSGAGKSTLLNVLSGIDNVSSGSILFNGQEISSFNEKDLTDYRRENIGFIFQFYNLIHSLSVEENLKIMNKICDNTLDVNEVLKLVGLEKHAKKIPAKLSGGEQQRVAIARGLYKNPKVLFCDEPTGALDTETGVQILSAIKDFNKRFNTTVILVTHNRLISEIAGRIIEVKDGKILSDVINKNVKDVKDLQW